MIVNNRISGVTPTTVHDLPPKREKPAMTADERLKLEKELIAVRDRQVSAGKAKRGGARAQPTNR